MSIHLHACHSDQGWKWLVHGVQLFKRKPGELFLLGNTYIFLVLLLGMLLMPFGSIIMSLIIPLVSAGSMVASQQAFNNQRATPALLFSGLHLAYRKKLKPLLMLGLIFTAYLFLIWLMSRVLLGPQPSINFDAIKNNTVSSEELAHWVEYAQAQFFLNLVCSIPLLLAFWFAPSLVLWHNMSPIQALFSSSIAIWRNKVVFVVYGLAWLGLLMLFGFCLQLLSVLVGGQTILLIMAYILATSSLMGITIASYYPSYRAIFEGLPLGEPSKPSLP